MTHERQGTSAERRASYDFILSRSSETDAYGVWRFDAEHPELLTPLPVSEGAKLDRTHQIIAVGNYLIEWGPLAMEAYDPCYPYRLFVFDPTSPDPLNAAAVQKGLWPKKKFFSSRADFGNPNGASKNYEKGTTLMLVPLNNFVLNLIPTTGRGTFELWNFDACPVSPCTVDPLPHPYTQQGAFETIQFGHELLPIGNYVLDRVPETGEYWLWSFDPQSFMPLAQPTIQEGRWVTIDASHQLVIIGDLVLDWVPRDRTYRLWTFDPKSPDPLVGPLREGRLPAGLDAHTTLTAVQPILPTRVELADRPGTIDFMRSKIKHVVYYMLENRAFDHVCGWLYEKGEEGVHFIGSDKPFQGTSTEYFNYGDDEKGHPRKIHVSKYEDGKLSTDWPLELLSEDPYHDNSDVMRQLFYRDREGYDRRAVPSMGGFVWNNGTPQVMETYSPEQLPILNGLAKHFAVSDEFFCSMPGPTDENRAFSVTGSALDMLENFQNGYTYEYWPYSAHRPSIWKVLWSNGFTDWKIYNSIEWMGFVFTYHLFLAGQIPTVDADTSNYIAGIDQFKADARAGKLPAFSYLEPIWVGSNGTTSYHPGSDLVPGERALNEIYDAIKAGPAWEETLLVITFDEHGGIFDHVPPPYAEKAWPNDVDDGFRYDLLGPRIPAILVSPWIKDRTVFRSETPISYDLTSVLATLLDWYGVPKSRWGLGERTRVAPTFEGVLREKAPRKHAPTLTPPYDKDFPPTGGGKSTARVNDLQRLMTPRLIWALAGGKIGPTEARRMSKEILARATDASSLHRMIAEQIAKLR